MKNLFLSIIFYFFIVFSNGFTHVGHYKNYEYLEYELFRNNKSIGYHKYDFLRKSNELTVKSIVEFKITKLNIDLYKYYAESIEKYKNGLLYDYSDFSQIANSILLLSMNYSEYKKNAENFSAEWKNLNGLDKVVELTL